MKFKKESNKCDGDTKKISFINRKPKEKNIAFFLNSRFKADTCTMHTHTHTKPHIN